MTNDHAICRAHLALVMPEVRKTTTPEQRKAAWPWKTGTNLGQGHEFHGPDNFYWWGRACCLWEARAKGWQAWLDAQAPTPEGAQMARALTRAARGVPNNKEQRERWERLGITATEWGSDDY